MFVFVQQDICILPNGGKKVLGYEKFHLNVSSVEEYDKANYQIGCLEVNNCSVYLRYTSAVSITFSLFGGALGLRKHLKAHLLTPEVTLPTTILILEGDDAKRDKRSAGNYITVEESKCTNLLKK